MNIERSAAGMSRILQGRSTGTHLHLQNALTVHGQKEISLQDILLVLRRRTWTLLGCVLIGTAAAIGVSVLQPKTYEGIARLKVDRESSDSFGLETLAEVSDADIKLQTEVNVLNTDSLAWDVIKRLRLDQHPEMGHRLFVDRADRMRLKPGSVSR